MSKRSIVAIAAVVVAIAVLGLSGHVLWDTLVAMHQHGAPSP